MELTHYHEEERPWGSFVQFTLNEPSTVKILEVDPDQAFSLQTHERRSEFWRVIKGTGTVTVGEVTEQAVVGNEFYIPAGSVHRIEGGPEGITVLEIAFGDFDESDITRLEDRYGRS